ncbi:hypothetical protein BJV74DRAFT_887195 [Russula compacta]|nr:hypothetical protein BJV74DRAFT_887195 [Russula compacta]
MSAPTTPQPLRTLEVPPEERDQFGSAALELQRQRRIHSNQPATSTLSTSREQVSAVYTILPTVLIFRVAFHGHADASPPALLTLADACAQQRALRAALRCVSSLVATFREWRQPGYNERGGESYWEDVRTVMGLLTSALANATAPLIEALDVAEHERLRTQIPMPALSSRTLGPHPLNTLHRHRHSASSKSSSYYDDKDDKLTGYCRHPSHRPLHHCRATSSALRRTSTHDQERGVLVVGLERLPPPGIEQVFEADADADADNTQPLLPPPPLETIARGADRSH